MKTLLNQIAEQVARATSGRTFRDIVLICDGKDTIWSAAASKPELHDATWILDFYHASENLKKAAKAIFGEGNAADRWHKRHRDKLLLHDQAVDNLLRTLRRYLRLSNLRSDARDILENAITYFCKHRERMRYATFIASGLPIGSGPVEAAAKNIVQARLRRSGMRWSRDGGQHVLDLRCYLKSNRWQVMWDTLTRAA